MVKGRPTRQGWLIPALLLFVLLPVGFAVYTATTGSGDDQPRRPDLQRTGSTEVATKAGSPPLALGAEPESYELTYRVERYDPDRIAVSEDRLTVRRPFDSRVTSYANGKKTGDRASRFGVLAITTGVGPRTLVSPPSPATGDLRLTPALEDAVSEKWVEVRERRRVAGQICQVYRAGSTIVAGQLIPIGTTAGEHSDLCVDRAGLLLEEVWFKDGHVLQRRIATKRRINVTIPDATFVLGPDESALTIDQGNGFLREVEPTSAFEGSVYRLEPGPDGAQYVGRFVVQPPKLSPFQSPLDTETEKREQVSMIDVWTRGIDAFVFSQTIAADISAIPNDAKTAKPVQLGPVPSAAVILDFRSNELRAELPEARFLRLAGTVTRQQLFEIAGALRAESGTGLVFR